MVFSVGCAERPYGLLTNEVRFQNLAEEAGYLRFRERNAGQALFWERDRHCLGKGIGGSLVKGNAMAIPQGILAGWGPFSENAHPSRNQRPDIGTLPAPVIFMRNGMGR